MPTPDRTPRVRAIVVNYNGGDHVVRCIEALTRTEWPDEAFEIVVVDNASTDGSGDAIEADFPDVPVIRTPVNLGFAGGNNLALGDLGDVDVVALVNNDAFVSPDWLAPLVEALDEADVGAANAKLLFAPRFIEVGVETDAFVPRGGDARVLGTKILDIECEGKDVWPECEFGDGVHGVETSDDEPHARWTETRGSVFVALPEGTEPPVRLRLRLASDRVKAVKVSWASGDTTVQVGPEPAWIDLMVGGEPFDVINNVGNVLLEGGYGADRGFREIDRGQFDRPEDVFAWCGGAVALKREYLDDVGIFDDDFHLYYEDFDLSWRGRLLGWRYRYVPSSVVRHMHATTTGEGSALFDHYVHRNRLLTLAKNAPVSLVVAQLFATLREIWQIARREVVRPLLRLRRPTPDYTRRRLRSLGAFFRHLRAVLRERRKLERRRRVSREELLRWAGPPP